MSLRHIKSFSSLFESTSAGSHDRGYSDVPPFKYAINFDHRIGYSKDDFAKDLNEIYLRSSSKEKSEMMDFIFKNSGILKISQIPELSQEKIDTLIKDLEGFLDSRAEHNPKMLPDGYLLCYENLRKKGRRCDVYYSPSLKSVKICFTDSYPEKDDEVISLEDFIPDSVGINQKEFSNLLSRMEG
jgi:hypothetical protein